MSQLATQCHDVVYFTFNVLIERTADDRDVLAVAAVVIAPAVVTAITQGVLAAVTGNLQTVLRLFSHLLVLLQKNDRNSRGSGVKDNRSYKTHSNYHLPIHTQNYK